MSHAGKFDKTPRPQPGLRGGRGRGRRRGRGSGRYLNVTKSLPWRRSGRRPNSPASAGPECGGASRPLTEGELALADIFVDGLRGPNKVLEFGGALGDYDVHFRIVTETQVFADAAKRKKIQGFERVAADCWGDREEQNSH